MSYSFGHNLWDKPNAIISFNDNNTLVMEKFQKFMIDFSKTQLLNIMNQRRCFEKFLQEIDEHKNSEYSFLRCSYFLSEKIFEILNIQETFNEMLLKEVDEIIKEKLISIKKETKNWKNLKKKMFEDLSKENQKHDLEFKRYCTRHSIKETAYNTYLRAEENKSLSRNQVDNYHKLFLSRKLEYEQSKMDYSTVLDNFNNYHMRHYNNILPEWSLTGEEIEKHRYAILLSTFTNLSELFRSLASKANEIAEKIEFQSDGIQCGDDCQALINKERTGDVPPGTISFKDLDSESSLDSIVQDKRRGFDSIPVVNGKPIKSTGDIHAKNESQSSMNLSISASSSSTSSNSNGQSGSSGSKIFTKLFGVKKAKDSSTTKTEVETLRALLDEKIAISSTYEYNDELEREIEDIRIKLEVLESDSVKSNKNVPQRKNSLFQSLRTNPRKKSIDNSMDMSKDNSIISRNSSRNSRANTEKRRSQSVSSIHRSREFSNNYNSDEQSIYYLQASDFGGSIRKPKNNSSGFTTGSCKERKEIISATQKTIEVIRNAGPVEIVSTPVDAISFSEGTDPSYTPDFENSESQSYLYYYIGSCVAIHEYTTCDPSDIYLSFSAGEQFYIVQDGTECGTNGWLLVERIDRSKFGYVPESYMDTRKFNDPVPMQSSHPMMIT